MRHGKSSWDHTGINDIDRPLIPKGIVNTGYIAERIYAEFGKPEKIMSSPASRAFHTAIIVARTMNIDPGNIQIISSLYETDTSTVLDEIEKTPDSIGSLMIVGHNPTFTQLANSFLKEYIDNIPTSGVVTFHFDSKNWQIIDQEPIHSHIEFPKKDYFSQY